MIPEKLRGINSLSLNQLQADASQWGAFLQYVKSNYPHICLSCPGNAAYALTLLKRDISNQNTNIMAEAKKESQYRFKKIPGSSGHYTIRMHGGKQIINNENLTDEKAEELLKIPGMNKMLEKVVKKGVEEVVEDIPPVDFNENTGSGESTDDQDQDPEDNGGADDKDQEPDEFKDLTDDQVKELYLAELNIYPGKKIRKTLVREIIAHRAK